MQIDTAKFVASKQKSRRQNVYDLENTLCCDYEIDDIIFMRIILYSIIN